MASMWDSMNDPERIARAKAEDEQLATEAAARAAARAAAPRDAQAEMLEKERREARRAPPYVLRLDWPVDDPDVVAKTARKSPRVLFRLRFEVSECLAIIRERIALWGYDEAPPYLLKFEAQASDELAVIEAAIEASTLAAQAGVERSQRLNEQGAARAAEARAERAEAGVERAARLNESTAARAAEEREARGESGAERAARINAESKRRAAAERERERAERARQGTIRQVRGWEDAAHAKALALAKAGDERGACAAWAKYEQHRDRRLALESTTPRNE